MPQYTRALACELGFMKAYPSKMIRDTEAAQKEQWNSHVRYNCADRVSVW